MNSVAATSGIGWCNAISTAKWTGAKLRDVLVAAGVNEDDVYNSADSVDGEASLNNGKGVKHVHFIGADGMQASIPIKKALSRDGDVLLAYGRYLIFGISLHKILAYPTTHDLMLVYLIFQLIFLSLIVSSTIYLSAYCM